MTKIPVRHTPYLRNYTSYGCDFWYTCEKWCYLQQIFTFFRILIFGVVRGVKGQKTVQNDKKFYLSHSISQEPYIIWFSFIVHMCKMIISPGFFFIFSKFWFSGFSGGWKGKKWPKMTKMSVCCTFYFRNHISYDLHVWYTCMYKRIISPGIFWFFQNLDIWDHQERGCRKRVKNGLKWQKFFVCLTPCLRNHTSYDCDFWCTCVKWWYLQEIFFIFQNFDLWGF